MLSELKLSNFRIFDDEVTVRFRPLTVLIGRNSSGKSSIVKLHLMLKQFASMSTSSPFSFVNGPGVKMGTFAELQNAKTKRASLKFGLLFRAPFPLSKGTASRLIQQYEKADKDRLELSVQGEYPYSNGPHEGTISYSLGEIDSATELFNSATRFAEDYVFSEEAEATKLIEISEELQQYGSLTELDRVQASHLKKLLQDFLDKSYIGNILRSELKSVYHLPPNRHELDRVVDTSHMSIDSVGMEGRLALAHLERIQTKDAETYRFLLPYLRNVAGITSVAFETNSEETTRAFAKNRETGANVLIADYGFGVGQCLPVLVQGAIMPPHTTLMVEQPEAQLHPTAQLELASFFADLWTQRNVGSIIETHSSNILLRLRRLVARGELSHKDVSVAFFTIDEERGNVPIVKNLDINEDGSMQSGLPMEFFNADIGEGLMLGVRA